MTRPSGTGSRPTGQAPAGLDAPRFDPARIVEYIIPRLGKAQRRVILSLDEDWGRAACGTTARRMFYGVTDRDYTLVHHKHMTDNSWRLSDLGMRVKSAIATEAGTAEPQGGSVHEGAAIAQDGDA